MINCNKLLSFCYADFISVPNLLVITPTNNKTVFVIVQQITKKEKKRFGLIYSPNSCRSIGNAFGKRSNNLKNRGPFRGILTFNAEGEFIP